MRRNSGRLLDRQRNSRTQLLNEIQSHYCIKLVFCDFRPTSPWQRYQDSAIVLAPRAMPVEELSPGVYGWAGQEGVRLRQPIGSGGSGSSAPQLVEMMTEIRDKVSSTQPAQGWVRDTAPV